MKNILFFVFIQLVSLNCKREKCCPRYFQIPVEIQPRKREYHVGDTITVISQFNRNVEAFNSNLEPDALGTFDMEGTQWKPTTIIFRTDSLIEYDSQSLTSNFTFIKDENFDYGIYFLSNGFTGLDGEYNYQNDTFGLKVRLVANKVGTFLLTHRSELFAGHFDQNFPGACDSGRGGFDVWTQMNGLNANNIDLLKESPNEYLNEHIFINTKTRFYQLGRYCFRVVP